LKAMASASSAPEYRRTPSRTPRNW
jgi:hypothetical protein